MTDLERMKLMNKLIDGMTPALRTKIKWTILGAAMGVLLGWAILFSGVAVIVWAIAKEIR